MADLQRITTEYLEDEDRIRLSGEDASHAAVVLWLTQRLLNRLITHLLAWLEQQTDKGSMGEVFLGFAQQSAMATLEPQPPVQSMPQSRALLVHTVTVAATDEGVKLEFRCAGTIPPADPDDGIVLMLQPQPLRQWLGILHKQYRRAQWPMAVSPHWMAETPGRGGVFTPVLMH